ncbi:MAG TPA: hypothetical protein VGZ89_00940 [Xanthobacteraceae bacterium]|jgi:hypothetical protein|nr:hypothetical protein [Xanthobacteraceae bacterium]
MRNSKTHKSPPSRRPDEAEVTCVGQHGSVWLRDPDDLDLFVEIGYGRLTIAAARKIVAARRRDGQS